MRDVKLPFFLVPWAEGREANFCRVPRLMLGTFTALKISITHFLPTPLATFLVTYHKDEGCQTSIFLGPWAEGREANFYQVPRLMLGTFTALKISITNF